MSFEFTEPMFQELAKSIAHNCFRNTSVLENNLHTGVFPGSKAGDYSDVKVISPFGEIPWNRLSRISDGEMMALNKEVVNRVYTYLKFFLAPNNPGYVLRYPSYWQDAEVNGDLQAGIDKFKARIEKQNMGQWTGQKQE